MGIHWRDFRWAILVWLALGLSVALWRPAAPPAAEQRVRDEPASPTPARAPSRPPTRLADPDRQLERSGAPSVKPEPADDIAAGFDEAIDDLQRSLDELDRTVSAVETAREAMTTRPSPDPENSPREEPSRLEPVAGPLAAVQPPAANAPRSRARRVAGIVGKAAVLALFDQARRSPQDWAATPAGLGRRFGSRLGRSAADRTLAATVVNLRNEPGTPCRFGRGSVLSRVRRAAWGTVRSAGPGGALLLAPPVAAFGSALISLVWQPPSRHSLGWGLRSGAFGLMWKAGMNVAREFAPRRLVGSPPCPVE